MLRAPLQQRLQADARSVRFSTAPISAPQLAGSIGVRCSRAGSHAACAAGMHAKLPPAELGGAACIMAACTCYAFLPGVCMQSTQHAQARA